MTPKVTMRAALNDTALLGSVLAGDTWRAWRVMLMAAMGESLSPPERKLFAKLTGRNHGPSNPVEELWLVVGRRGGKTRAMAVLASYLGGLCEHRLSPGEQGVVLCIAPDQK